MAHVLPEARLFHQFYSWELHIKRRHSACTKKTSSSKWPLSIFSLIYRHSSVNPGCCMPQGKRAACYQCFEHVQSKNKVSISVFVGLVGQSSGRDGIWFGTSVVTDHQQVVHYHQSLSIYS